MWCKYVKNIKITVYTSYMEKFVSLLLAVMCVSLSIMSMCVLCRILHNWNIPYSPFLSDVESEEEIMTWREVE